MALAGISGPEHLGEVVDAHRKTVWRWLVAENAPPIRKLVRMEGILLWESQRYDLTVMWNSSLWPDAAIDRFARDSKIGADRLLALIGGASLSREFHTQEWWRLFELTQMWKFGYRLDSIAFLDWQTRETRWLEGRRPRFKRAVTPAPEMLPYDPLDGHMSLRFGGVDSVPEEVHKKTTNPTDFFRNQGVRR